MRENRPSGSEGGEAELNRPSLPLSREAGAVPRASTELLNIGRRQMRRNRYAVYVRHICRLDSETLEDVLRTLGRAAMHAERRIHNATRTQDGEYVAEVQAEEAMCIEDLLGCAFVATQGYITRVNSRLIWLHDRLKRDGHCLTTTKGKKGELIRAYSDVVSDTSYTQVQVIDAFANYFKHHEEWHSKWENEKGPGAKRTIPIIQAVGAAEDSTDNCRNGLAALGIREVFDVYTMAEILRRWHKDLTDAYARELKSLG